MLLGRWDAGGTYRGCAFLRRGYGQAVVDNDFVIYSVICTFHSVPIALHYPTATVLLGSNGARSPGAPLHVEKKVGRSH